MKCGCVAALTDDERLQVPQLKAALRARGVRYGARPTKAALVELLRWSLAQESEGPAVATGAPLAAASVAAAQQPDEYVWRDAASGDEGAQKVHDSAKPGTAWRDVEMGPDISTISAVMVGTAHLEAMPNHLDRETEDAKAPGAAQPTAPAVTPGTQQLQRQQRVASATEAAREKERAGENKAVEHVALHDDIAGGAIDDGRHTATPATPSKPRCAQRGHPTSPAPPVTPECGPDGSPLGGTRPHRLKRRKRGHEQGNKSAADGIVGKVSKMPESATEGNAVVHGAQSKRRRART
jgi:hypothetical protein